MTLELIVLSLLMIFLILVPLAMVTASRTPQPGRRALRNATFGYGMLAGALPDFLLGLSSSSSSSPSSTGCRVRRVGSASSNRARPSSPARS